MTENPSDLAQCLSRVRQSEPEAARLLVERLYPLVIRIVRSHRPVRTAEEDLAQEVFAKLFARLDQYQERSDVPFEHWVSRLAVRTCLDALRAERNCAGAIFPRNHRRGWSSCSRTNPLLPARDPTRCGNCWNDSFHSCRPTVLRDRNGELSGGSQPLHQAAISLAIVREMCGPIAHQV